MKELYTISCFKVFNAEKACIENVNYKGEQMDAIFCESENGCFVIFAKYRKTAPYRSCGRYHSGKGFFDVYYRKNFLTREEGNSFYRNLKKELN